MAIQEANPVRGNKPLVLLVDDDLGVLSALRRQLREEPYDVLAVTSAALALASLRSRAVEVVVSDERMPDANGSELLAEVRARWPWIGRVILTAYPGEELTIRGLEAGIDFILPKPWDAEASRSCSGGWWNCWIEAVPGARKGSPETPKRSWAGKEDRP